MPAISTTQKTLRLGIYALLSILVTGVFLLAILFEIIPKQLDMYSFVLRADELKFCIYTQAGILVIYFLISLIVQNIVIKHLLTLIVCYGISIILVIEHKDWLYVQEQDWQHAIPHFWTGNWACLFTYPMLLTTIIAVFWEWRTHDTGDKKYSDATILDDHF